jgi:methionyl-tRNA formyltransferase
MPLKIIFMGSPEFAIPSLLNLIESEHKILCVYTQPPKKKSRGHKISKTPVHLFSEKSNLIVKTNKLTQDQEYKEFINFKPDLVVVVAYGQIIPEKYLNIPNLIFLNLHASLLPKWRGAAPIERAILNKDKETGISIMKIEKKLDAGPYIKQLSVKISKETTSGELLEKLSKIGSKALADSIELINSKKAIFKKQNEDDATYANKIDKVETKIDWNDKAENVIAKINAFSPKPGAWFFMQNERIKILKAEEVEQKGNIAEVMNVNFTIGCAENSVKILRLQKEGKKEMDVSEFLLGTKLKKGTKIN